MANKAETPTATEHPQVHLPRLTAWLFNAVDRFGDFNRFAVGLKRSRLYVFAAVPQSHTTHSD
jgi:hypothetical protein